MYTRSDLFDLSDRVALVTGGSSGIGLSIAEVFAAAGAHVVVSSNEPDACATAAAAIRQAGGAATSIPCDMSHRDEVESLAKAVIAKLQRIDILVCAAGVAPHFGALAEATEADWQLTMTVNLRSVEWLTRIAIPDMASRQYGIVIIVSSIAGVRGNKSLGLYGISKAAGAQLARNLAVEWGPRNIRVNAISPGLIRTRFADPLLGAPADILQRRLSLTPLRRAGEPHEVAGVALLLASPAGAFITGQNLVVDGGTTISDGN